MPYFYSMGVTEVAVTPLVYKLDITQRVSEHRPEFSFMVEERSTMSKYKPLLDYLTKQQSLVVLSFVEIERLLGAPLPSSARRWTAWWSNEVEGSHVQARSWMDAGFITANIDLNAGSVTFQRSQHV